MKRISLAVSALALSALLAGCGGGGGGSAAAPPVNPGGGAGTGTVTLPAPSLVNVPTTYTVYGNMIGGALSIGLAPYNSGPPDATPGWTALSTGAEIVYPDGSVQVSDSLGNFDASQSAWAVANSANLAANPQIQPEIQVVAYNIAPQNPLDTFISAYAPAGSPQVTAGVLRSAQGMRSTSATSAATSDLAGITVFPRGVAMFDNESRIFTAVASDSDGQYVNLTQAGGSVAWSVVNPCGGTAAGSVKAFANDTAKASYTPPKSGTFPAGCQDLVKATVTASNSTFSASGNAFYYDPSQGVQITGTLNDSTQKPVTKGLVYFYGGGREFYRGNLVALTNASGVFTRTLPPNRTLSPVGGNISVTGGKASASFFTLTPATVAAGAAGSTIAAATYTETVPFQNPFKPLPPLDRAIRDAFYLGNISLEQFPFNRPNASNTYGACSIDGIINGQANSTSCPTVATGDYYAGWTVTKSGSTYIFQQPSTQEGGRHLLQVTVGVASVPVPNGISDTNTQALTCTSTSTPCFTFARFYNPSGFTSAVTTPLAETLAGAPAGTILAADGGFNEAVGPNAGQFTVYYLRNEYSVGHQTPGSPLNTHTLKFAYTGAGASTPATIANNWYNAAGLPAGTLAITRTPSTTPGVAFTYQTDPANPATRSYYKGASKVASITYSITNGVQNVDRTGAYTLTLLSTSAGDQSSVGTAVSFNFQNASTTSCGANYPAPATSSSVRVCGVVTNPNTPPGVTLATANTLAYFAVDSNFYATMAVDPALGTNTAAFHL